MLATHFFLRAVYAKSDCTETLTGGVLKKKSSQLLCQVWGWNFSFTQVFLGNSYSYYYTPGHTRRMDVLGAGGRSTRTFCLLVKITFNLKVILITKYVCIWNHFYWTLYFLMFKIYLLDPHVEVFLLVSLLWDFYNIMLSVQNIQTK